MRKFLTFCAALVAASLFLLPGAAQAQKALVYCPPTDNATCATLVTTLSATGGYPGGVDRAYDGTAGSVDLKTADLFAYTVFFVPSLSDGEAGTPYALLRDATVAERLRAALIGRRAFWSGTPDLGASNRDKKNALIANLASWAGAKFATVQGPGLVVLQDNSDNEATQYNWVNGLLGFTITSDHDPKSYASVRTISAAGVAIVTSNGASLAYENMASYGFYLPNGAPGVSLDAVGQTGTAVGGEVVLVTSEGANTGGATIKTDKNDYAPGTTVVMTGAGFGAGESVTLTLHEDPQVHEDRTFTATADANGAFTFSGFAPEQHHIGVRFVLTAVGQASGKRAQTTFTDGNADFVGQVTNSNTGAPIVGATVSASCSVGCGPSTTVTTATTDATGNYSIKVNYSGNGNITVALSASATGFTSQSLAAAQFGNGSNTTRNFALVSATVPATTAISSSLNPSTFGASITLTATLSPSNATGSVQFTDGGVNLGAPATVSGGVATLTTSTLSVASHAISAVYTPGTGFTAGAVTGLTQVVNKASAVVTLGGLSATYDGSPKSITASTTPPGLPLDITYNGAAALPTNTGSYAVVATVNSPNYQGSASGTLIIGKAAQIITFAQPAGLTYGGGALQVSGTASSNLVVTFEATGACAIASGGAANMVSPTSAGTCTVTATQPGDANYDAAPNVQYSVTVAPKSVSIGSVAVAGKAYDGTTAATITDRQLAVGSAVGGDVVTLTGGTAAFVDKTVGTSKPVNVSGLILGGANATNYTLASSSTTTNAAITALTVTPVVTVSNKQYDATDAATITTSEVAGRISGDVVTLTGGTATFADKHVGTGKTVSVSGLTIGGTDAGNYLLSSTTALSTANITAKAVTVGSVTVADKIYDGNTSAIITLRTLAADGVLGTDAVSLIGGTALFVDKAAGAGKAVNVTGLSLDGADAGNYSLGTTSAGSSAAITQKSVTASITASNKEYDGTTTATATGTTSGTISGDAVTVTVTGAAFDNASVGTNAVTATVALSGADANNYTLGAATTASTTASITAKALTLGAIVASNKVYDGNTTATLTSGPAPTGVIGSDVVTLTGGSVTFADKGVANGKTVTATGYTLGGAAAGNYTLLSSASVTTTANITAATITGSSITADTKVYDGLRTAQTTGTLGSGKVGTDALTLVVTNALFDTKDVGATKTVTADLSLTGADAPNYTLASLTATATAAITAKSLTGSFTANSKVYDATTAATVLASSLPGVISPDEVTLALSQVEFASKQVGTGKTVSANLALTGTGATNYTVNPTATATADITKATINGSFTASDKTYDATTAAAILTRVIGAGLLSDDAVTLTGGAATFDTKNVGSGKVVTGSGFTLGGTDGGNYNLATVATTTANITPAPITPVFTASNKVYDATTAATIATRSLTGKLGTDAVTLDGGTATFADKNVGSGKTVTATGFTIIGGDAGNYELGAPASTTADITRAPITASVTAANKIYDGNTTAAASPAAGGGLTGRLDNDVLSLVIGTASFDNKNVGTGKTVTVAVTLGGGDAGNYALPTPVTTTAEITQKATTGSITAADKVYDGNATATIVDRTLSGIVSGDVVSLTGSSATFDNKNVGTGKPVNATGLGLTGGDAGNYSLTATTASTTASITQKQLVASATASNKVYDGLTTAAAGATITGMVTGDDISVGVTSANFANKNVGTAKTVTVNVALGGIEAPNYSLLSAAPTATADITAKALTGGFTAADKTYDGNTSAVVTPVALEGVVTGDNVTLAANDGTFSSKDVGDRTVSANLSITGGDAGNYTINPTSTAPAKITRRAVTATADAKTRVYGDADPALTYQITVGSLVAGETFDGAITRAAGENVGLWAITQGTLALSANYELTYLPANLTITPRAITVTAAAKSKTYGDADPALTYAITTGNLVFSDAFTGDLTRAAGGTVAGSPYAILQGTLSTGTNYTLTYVGANLTITPKALMTGTITAAGKQYDGNTTATITTTDLPERVGQDAVVLAVGTATFDTKHAGAGKTVTGTGLTLTGNDAGNYTLTPTSLTTTAEITKRPVAVTADPQSKIYGTLDPSPLTYRVTSPLGLVDGDSFTGVLDRATGEDVVAAGYAIERGALAIVDGATPAGNNYAFTFTGNTLQITARSLSVGSVTVADRVYDGTNAASITGTTFAAATPTTGVVGTDDVKLTSGTALFADKNVGAGKTVTITGLVLDGAKKGNYALTSGEATSTASITPKTIENSSVSAATKVYDGLVTASATPTLGTGKITGDVLTLTVTGATFDNANVGTGKTVTVQVALDGADKGNYSLNPSTPSQTASLTTTASITAAATTTTVSPVTASEGATSLTLAAQIQTAAGVPISTVVNEGTVTLVVTRNATTVPAVPATIVGTFSNLAVSAGVVSKTLNFGTDLSDPVASSAGYSIAATFTPALNYGASNGTNTVTVANGAPTISSASITTAPTATNANFTMSAKFTDPGLATDDYVARVTFTAAGLTTQPVSSSCSISAMPQAAGTTSTGCAITKPTAGSEGTLTINRSFAAAGVYKVTLTITDRAGLSAIRDIETFLVVFDPSGGFVTGGGWIDSPRGAYVADESLVGKANFGFVSKYQKGNTQPSGNTEFQFKAGNMNFKSSSYEWLVIAGARAQYKGVGTINGSGEYGFMLTGIDGQENGGGGVDKFRIKIWLKATGAIVYDNQVGATDDAAPTTTLGGGSIQIQSK